MKSTFIAAAFTSLLTLAAADPPACLLAALTAQDTQSSMPDLCTTRQSAMIGNLTAVCNGGELLKHAYDTYAATCLEIGVKVNDLPESSANPASATSTTALSSSYGHSEATPTPTSETTT